MQFLFHLLSFIHTILPWVVVMDKGCTDQHAFYCTCDNDEKDSPKTQFHCASKQNRIVEVNIKTFCGHISLNSNNIGCSY